MPDRRTAAEKETFEWASALFHLRKAHVAITRGGQENLFADSSSFVFVRGDNLDIGCKGRSGPERILVFANDSDVPRQLELTTAKTALEDCTVFTPLLPSSATAIRSEGGKLDVILESGAAIYDVK
jgi:glycosidase